MCYPNTLPWRWRLCVYVRWMYGTVSCCPPGRTARTCVLVCAWIWSCYSCSMQYEVVISPWCAVQIHRVHYNGDDGCAFMFVECMKRCRIGPGRTGSAFVLVCACIWSCYSCSMRCSMRVWGRNVTLTCCPNTQQWRWRLCVVYVHWMYGMLLRWPWPNRRCGCIGVHSKWKLLLVFVAVWGRKYHLPWCDVQINFNRHDGSTFTFVERVMTVGDGRTYRQCVCIAGCLNFKLLLCSKQYEVVISPPPDMLS